MIPRFNASFDERKRTGTCPSCGTIFLAKTRTQRFCKPACREAHKIANPPPSWVKRRGRS